MLFFALSYRELRKAHIEKFNLDRKSTRLNSSHVAISYAVFCLKKKNDARKTLREYEDVLRAERESNCTKRDDAREDDGLLREIMENMIVAYVKRLITTRAQSAE